MCLNRVDGYIIRSMRKILVILAFFLLVGFVMVSLGELEKTLYTLQHFNLLFLLLGIMLQVLYFAGEAYGYRALYRLMDINESLWHLSLVSIGANFINVVAPSGGVGGMAVFADDAHRRGLPKGKAAAVAALFLFLEYAAFLLVLLLGLAVFFRRSNDLGPGEISAVVMMVALVAGFGVLIYIGSHSGPRLAAILGWTSRQINRLLWNFIHREYFRETVAREFALEVAEGLSILRLTHRSNLVVPYSLELLAKIIQIMIFATCFLGFGVDFSIGTVIAGFAMCYLFLIISPTPSGVGIVEIVLPSVLVSLRVPLEQAVVVTLAYRAITFWMPLALGAVAFRQLQKG